MKISVLNDLCCPSCQGDLSIADSPNAKFSKHSEQEFLEGLLGCDNCDRSFPVICGVALMLSEAKSWLRDNYYYVLEGAFRADGISAEMQQWLDQQGWNRSASPADNYYELPRWIDIFLNSHFDARPAGFDDNSELATLINGQKNIFTVLADELEKLLPGTIATALDVGANVGGMSYRLADLAKHVIAIDTAFNPILTARRLLLKSPTPISQIRRYKDGLDFENISANYHTPNIEFFVSSVYQLPTQIKFDLITSLNVIDVVPEPEQFIDRLISHTKPGGFIAVTSPYSWGSDDVPIDKWLGDANSGSDEALIELLNKKGLKIKFEMDRIPWVLREHNRWYRLFHNHCVIAQLPAH